MSISSLVDRILESDDYLSVLREVKQYNTKSFDEFAKQIQDFDNRIKKKNIETTLNIDTENKAIDWLVKQGHGKDKDRHLVIKSYDDGSIACDKSQKFYVPGTANINTITDANDLLKRLDAYLYELERSDSKKADSKKEDDADADKEEKTLDLDPTLIVIMDTLKLDGEEMIDHYKSLPPFSFMGKRYYISKGTVMASTEREAIGSLEFPRDLEMDIYSNSLKGKSIRTALLAYYSKNGIKGHLPKFRMDMEKTPYFYFSVGPIPVKQAKGPEAKALLNYFDGKAVRFQPKE